MTFHSINPATDEPLGSYPAWGPSELEEALARSAAAAPTWGAMPVTERAARLKHLGEVIQSQRETLAQTITREMGKLIGEARAEVDKCTRGCDYYAAHAARFLAEEPVATDAHDTRVVYEPLGPVFTIMPWNFPLWQVMRFAIPALAAGNTVLLKHAPNVPQCAAAVAELAREAGLPEGVFEVLMIDEAMAAQVIEDERVRAVTLTGSERAGRSVAATAGAAVKKTVLELGGSDPFVVLEDADLEHAVAEAVHSRYQNCGQSCIAAKRFIVLDAVADRFIEAFRAQVEALTPGDPLEEGTRLAPMARHDLRDTLHAQVQDALAKGARAVTGCEPLPGPGAYYRPSILTDVAPGMRAFAEEVFGPVATVLRARDEAEAMRLANDTPYGLGGSVWTGDRERGVRLARALACGMAFVNEVVKSDPRLPAGGIKHSGYGRELSHHGLHEFVNAKTLWVA